MFCYGLDALIFLWTIDNFNSTIIGATDEESIFQFDQANDILSHPTNFIYELVGIYIPEIDFSIIWASREVHSIIKFNHAFDIATVLIFFFLSPQSL